MVVRRLLRIQQSCPAKLWKNSKIGTDDACAIGLAPDKAYKWLFNKENIVKRIEGFFGVCPVSICNQLRVGMERAAGSSLP